MGPAAGPREVSTYESMAVLALGSIGMHAAGGATAHQWAVQLSGAFSESGSVEAGAAVCVAQTIARYLSHAKVLPFEGGVSKTNERRESRRTNSHSWYMVHPYPVRFR